MNGVSWLLDAKLHILGSDILWREIVGNLFGLASMLLGMRRKVITWPVGIVGNVLLFTVFLGGVFHTPQDKDLWGQAGRQVFFLAVSVYGWWRWQRNRDRAEVGDGGAVAPRWASWRERGGLLVVAAACFVVFFFVLRALGSWGPAADAWILTGSVLATFGMARGWIEFWLIWIAVDVVGVPLLFSAGYYPSGLLYVIYGGFCLLGMVTWLRVRRRLSEREPGEPVAAATGGSLP